MNKLTCIAGLLSNLTSYTPARCRSERRSLGKPPHGFFQFLVLATVWLAACSVEASVYVQQMKLETLCEKAGRIIRGTVVKVSTGQVNVGGGLLPTVTYEIKVKDTMAGTPVGTVNFTMIAELKAPARQGKATRAPLLELPRLEEGGEYLLFATAPSKAGLTSPVGLAQGCFSISKKGDTEFAVNGANNVGLGLGAGGPIQYQELVKRIRALRPN